MDGNIQHDWRRIMRGARFAVVVFLSFLAYYVLHKQAMTWLYEFFSLHLRFPLLSYTVSYLISGIPVFIGLLLIHGRDNFFSSIGLNGSISRAFSASFLAALPMLLGLGAIRLLFPGQEIPAGTGAGEGLKMAADTGISLSLNRLVITTVHAAFFEEFFYRGFLFGQLFRFTRTGFVPAVIVSGLPFALGHLYQGNSTAELAGIFSITLAGSAFFSWLYTEWDNNLWVPVLLHFFMNLAWTIFSAGDNALGSAWPNIFRGLTIAVMVWLTIRFRRGAGNGFTVNRKTLWMK